MKTVFFGTPALYKKLAAGLSAYAISSVYLLFAFVEYYFLGEAWVFQPRMLVLVGALVVVFGFFAYFCFMFIDGQFLTQKDADQNKVKGIIPFP